jgi:hypothetical protein
LIYNEPGDEFTSYRGAGGYEILLGSNSSDAWNILRNQFYLEDWNFYGVSVISMDFVLYNENF